MRGRTLVYEIPPFSLMVMMLMYALSCLGEISIAFKTDEWGLSLPLIAGDALLALILGWKAVRKHLFAHLFQTRRVVLLDVCPLGMALGGLAYTLKAVGLGLIAFYHEEPRCFLESMNEFVLIALLLSRLFHWHQENGRGLLGALSDRPVGSLAKRTRKNRRQKRTPSL